MPASEHVKNEKTLTGNRIAVTVTDEKGSLLGFSTSSGGSSVSRVQNVTTSIGSGAHEVSELGNSDPVEIVHGLHRYQVSIDTLVLKSAADFKGVVNASPVTITVFDTGGGVETPPSDPIHVFTECTLVDERLTIAKHAQVARGLTFIGIAEG